MEEPAPSRRAILALGAGFPFVTAWSTPRIVASVQVGAVGSPPPPEPTTVEGTTTTTTDTAGTMAPTEPTTTTEVPPPTTTGTGTTLQPTDHPDVRGLENLTSPSGNRTPDEPNPPDVADDTLPGGKLAATGGALHPERGILAGMGAVLARLLLRRTHGPVLNHQSDGTGDRPESAPDPP